MSLIGVRSTGFHPVTPMAQAEVAFWQRDIRSQRIFSHALPRQTRKTGGGWWRLSAAGTLWLASELLLSIQAVKMLVKNRLRR